MRYNMQKSRAHTGVSVRGDGDFNRFRFDRYEPDNAFQTARQLTINTPQHHSFHWLRSRNIVSDCDQDWVTFQVNNTTGLLAITTEQARNQSPSTRIELYQNDGTTLIAADDDSNGNGFSRLSDVNLPAGRYFLRIFNRNGLPSNDIADYYLYVRQCIPTEHCYSDEVLASEEKRYAARDLLTSPCPDEQFIVHEDGTAIMTSEQRIILRPGFHARKDSRFTARITNAISCADNQTIVFGKREAVPPFWPITYSQPPKPSTNVFPGAVEYARMLGLLEADEEAPTASAAPGGSENLTLYPNPHATAFTADLALPEAGPVRLELLDLTGRSVLTLHEGDLPEGRSQLTFSPDLPAGVYLCRMTAAGRSWQHKLVRTR